MNLLTRITSFVILSAGIFLAVGCQHKTIGGPGRSVTSTYLLNFSISGVDSQDTVFASRDTTPILYAIYVSVRDSLTLRQLQHLLVSVSGTLTVDSANTRPLNFSYRSAYSDTNNPWGTDTLINWKIAKSDTGRARIQMKLFNSLGATLRQTTRDFIVRPAPQN